MSIDNIATLATVLSTISFVALMISLYFTRKDKYSLIGLFWFVGTIFNVQTLLLNIFFLYNYTWAIVDIVLGVFFIWQGYFMSKGIVQNIRYECMSEISQASGFLHDLKWTCRICSKLRDDIFISVHKVYDDLGSHNIRFCNDNPDCYRGAVDEGERLIKRYLETGSSMQEES